MPDATVITIDVDDSRFQDFLKKWDEFQKSAGSGSVHIGIDVAAADALVSIRAMRREIDAATHATRDLGRQLRHVHRTSGGIVRNFLKMSRDLRRGLREINHLARAVTAIPLGIATGTAFGFDRLAANAVSHGMRARGLTGTSVGQMRAFDIATQTLLPLGFLQRVAEAQQNPSQAAQLGLFAHMPLRQIMTGSTVQIASVVARAMTQFIDQNRNNPTVRRTGAIANILGMLGLGSSQAQDVLLNRTPGQLRHELASVNQRAPLLNLTNPQIHDFATFQRNAQFMFGAIATTLQRQLASLAAPSAHVMTNFRNAVDDLITQVLNPRTIAAITDGLNDFSNALKSGKVQEDLDDFGRAVKKVAEAIGSVVGLITGHRAPAQTVSEARAERNRRRRAEEAGAPTPDVVRIAQQGAARANAVELRGTTISALEARAARSAGVPQSIMRGVFARESSNNPLAANGVHLGLGQLSPFLRRHMSLLQSFEIMPNARAASAYMKRLYENAAARTGLGRGSAAERTMIALFGYRAGPNLVSHTLLDAGVQPGAPIGAFADALRNDYARSVLNYVDAALTMNPSNGTREILIEIRDALESIERGSHRTDTTSHFGHPRGVTSPVIAAAGAA